MMAVMTAQPPLALTPRNSRPLGAAASIVEDDDGGRVFVHGNLAYAWDAGDTAGRRFAAVSLIRIKAATQLQVAEAFAVKPATVRRWDAQHTDRRGCGRVGAGTQRPQTQVETHRRHSRGHPPAARARGVPPIDRRCHRGVGGQCPQRPQTRRRRR
jgi:hypothetical protein